MELSESVTSWFSLGVTPIPASPRWIGGGAASSVRSLSPFGERVGVRGSGSIERSGPPHPAHFVRRPLPCGEGASNDLR